MNSVNFSLFLNKPYHIQALHKKMLVQIGDKQFRLSNRFEKEGNFEELREFDFSGVDCKTITNNQKENVETLFSSFRELKFKPEWRLVLGLGGASVFDTDITLHHIYGVPYIPASSIKGVVRSWVITEFFGAKEAAPKEEQDFPLVNAEFRAITTSKQFCEIFGCPKDAKPVIFEEGKPEKVRKNGKWVCKEGKTTASALGYERAGKITFFDALPTSSEDIHISMDIMNVHYKDYYDSNKQNDGTYKKGTVKPPADWSNPTIINFLTVKNTPFQFLLASKDDSLNKLKIDDKTINVWLHSALTHHGIGAKTAVGYGYME